MTTSSNHEFEISHQKEMFLIRGKETNTFTQCLNMFTHVAFIWTVRGTYEPLLLSQIYYYVEHFCRWIFGRK